MNRITTMLLATSIAFSACERAERGVPAEYRSLPVPVARLRDPEAQHRGAALFRESCALCHGAAADGAGVRRTGLARRPTNFRDPAWQRRATPRRVFAVIREGVPAAGMPAWVAFDSDQTWDLVAYVLSLGEREGGA